MCRRTMGECNHIRCGLNGRNLAKHHADGRGTFYQSVCDKHVDALNDDPTFVELVERDRAANQDADDKTEMEKSETDETETDESFEDKIVSLDIGDEVTINHTGQKMDGGTYTVVDRESDYHVVVTDEDGNEGWMVSTYGGENRVHIPETKTTHNFTIFNVESSKCDDMEVCEECGDEKATVETHHGPATWESPGVPWAICDDCDEEIRRQNGEQAQGELETGI